MQLMHHAGGDLGTDEEVCNSVNAAVAAENAGAGSHSNTWEHALPFATTTSPFIGRLHAHALCPKALPKTVLLCHIIHAEILRMFT